MDKAEARRLQPHFVRSFFLKAFAALGGTIHQREAGRLEITYVPAEIRERDRLITGRNRREREPVLHRYERICFERSAIQPLDRPNATRAVLMHPGHPLMMALADVVLEKNAKDVALPLGNVVRTLDELQGRLDGRKRELQLMRHITSSTPVALGGALVIPDGLMRRLRGDAPEDPVAAAFAVDAAARARIEKIAMRAVQMAEEARGCTVVDVSAAKCGWDLTSYPPSVDGLPPTPRHIEVKGRIQGASTVTVTHNEMLYAFNQGDKFILAIVIVKPDDAYEGPHYIRNPFTREPEWGVASVNYKLGELLARAEAT